MITTINSKNPQSRLIRKVVEVLEQGGVKGRALIKSTNVSWTQHRHRRDIKWVFVLTNHWKLLVFLTCPPNFYPPAKRVLCG